MAVVLSCSVVTAMINAAGFEAEIAAYGSYHTNPMNQLIHFIFIPCIWWSFVLCLCYIPFPPLSLAGLDTIGGHRITWGTVAFIIYAVFYVSLHPVAGTIAAGVLFVLYLHASSAVAKERALAATAREKDKGANQKMPWFKFALILNAVSWYMQIHPGHKICEGVKPALMDSFGQALGVAPMFAVMEGMWFVGAMPEMKVRAQELVAIHQRAMCEQGQAMPWC